MKINLPVSSIVTLLICTLSSCSSSLIFSPGVNLPVKTLEKSQVDVQGGAELFPEARPEGVGAKVAPGGSLLLGYGISDKTAVYAKGWIGFNNKGIHGARGGFSLNCVNMIKQFGPNTKLLLLPKIGMLMDGGYRGGYGLELPVILHHTYRQKAGFYGGFGFIYGLYDFHKIETGDEKRLATGYAITNHLGTSVNLYKALRLNLELTTLFQHNQFEHVDHFIFAPSIGIGYTLK